MHNPQPGTMPLPDILPPGMENGRAHYIRGLVALRDGDTELAIELLTRALACQPAHAGMRRNLVRALLVAGRFEQAEVQAHTVLAAKPDDAEMHFARASALSALGQPARACPAFAHAIALQPDHAPSWLNLGNASADLDDLVSAEALCRTAIRLDPSLPEAHASLGYILTRQGRPADAVAACDSAIRLRADFTLAHWNRAVALLLSGDLAHGFGAYEWRKRHAPDRSHFQRLPGPAWDGSPPAGRTILVRAEQGAGDAIQFARYLGLIRDAGGRPILACMPSLVPLFGEMAVSDRDALPAYDAWIDMGSLPLAFGTTLATIPRASGYLTADPDRVSAWRARLPAGPTIGVALAGSARHANDRRRSIPPQLADPLLRLDGLSWVNLQHGAGAERLGLPDLTPRLTDFAETAALIQALDLVVTVDTAVAHLAGALGKPAWLLLAAAPDWRWLLRRLDSPWYASLRLIRQYVAGDWSRVLETVTEDLTQFAADAKKAASGGDPAPLSL